MTQTATAMVNGVDTEAIERMRELAREDAAKADRAPTAVARWIGGRASRVELGDVAIHVGGGGNPNSMQALLASLTACEVDVVALHAALIGVAVEELSVEATGHFNVRAYLGIDGAPSPGYDRISYRVTLRAPGATPAQIEYLRERCERSSPVGDSLCKPIPMTLDVETSGPTGVS